MKISTAQLGKCYMCVYTVHIHIKYNMYVYIYLFIFMIKGSFVEKLRVMDGFNFTSPKIIVSSWHVP